MKKAQSQEERDSMVGKLISVSESWGVSNANLTVPKLFDEFVQNLSDQVESTEGYYRAMMMKQYQALTTDGKSLVFSWESFAVVAFRISQLPATEAVAERAISHLQQLLPSNRYLSGDDLVDEQVVIRMQTVFDKANSQFGMNGES